MNETGDLNEVGCQFYDIETSDVGMCKPKKCRCDVAGNMKMCLDENYVSNLPEMLAEYILNERIRLKKIESYF